MKRAREDFLSKVGAIRGLWNEPWCVVGDFNMIIFPLSGVEEVVCPQR